MEMKRHIRAHLLIIVGLHIILAVAMHVVVINGHCFLNPQPLHQVFYYYYSVWGREKGNTHLTKLSPLGIIVFLKHALDKHKCSHHYFVMHFA